MNLFKKEERLKYIIDYSNPYADILLSKYIQEFIETYNHHSHWVIICIGTDRSTGDSLGPLVGSKLSLYSNTNFLVMGTLEEPIHAVNLEETISFINSNYSDSGIIAIDASLGKLSSVGNIQLLEGPLKPGAGVKKELPEIGDFHITGIVNIAGFMEYFVLQNTRLSVVMRMSEVISRALLKTIATYKTNKGNAVNIN